MRAVNCLDGFDSTKHSGVIAHFNQNYIKTGLFSKELSPLIKGASFLREKSDYDDFYVASKQDTILQLTDAKTFVAAVENYITSV